MKVKFEHKLFHLNKGFLAPNNQNIFTEHPTSMLDALTLSTKFNLPLSPVAEHNISLTAPRLERISPPDIYTRIEDVLINAVRPSTFFRLLRKTSLLEYVLPELRYCVDLKQGRTHTNDVFDHCLLTLDAVPTNKVTVRLAALLHDIGKHETRAVKSGQVVFDGHEVASTKLSTSWLTYLQAPTTIRDAVAKLVLYHDVLYPIAPDHQIAQELGPDLIEDLYLLWIGNAIGTGKPVPMMGHIAIRYDNMRRDLFG